MAAAPGRFLSSGTKWRPQAEPGGAPFLYLRATSKSLASALLPVPTAERDSAVWARPACG